MAVGQTTRMLDVPPPSRGKSAPTFDLLCFEESQQVSTTRQHTGAGQAFRRYNACLDRDKPD